MSIPTYEVEVTAEGRLLVQREQCGQMVLCSSPGSRLSERALENALMRRVADRWWDLLHVMKAIYAADRCTPRRGVKGTACGQTWTRNLRVLLPVQEPDFWNGYLVKTGLERLLAQLTDDDWSLEFHHGGSGRPSGQTYLFEDAQLGGPRFVQLFSGGLDSLAGLAWNLTDGSGDTTAIVTGVSSSRAGARKSELVRLIRDRHPNRVLPVSVEYRLQQPPKHSRQEPTQRTRCLLPLAAASIVAAETGAESIAVAENGVGAVNLPCTDDQVGARNTRACHPRFLHRVGLWFTEVLGVPCNLHLPHLFRTKGEMCRALPEAGLTDAITTTFSCDHFNSRTKQPQCGQCPSCLLRRQALFVSGLSDHDPADGYRGDVFGGLLRRASDDRSPSHFEMMAFQVQRLTSALAAPDPGRALMDEYPELLDALCGATHLTGCGADEVAERLLRLYGRYCSEWKTFEGAVGHLHTGAQEQHVSTGAA